MNEWRYIQNSTKSGHIDYELCREKFSHIENICGADRVKLRYVPFEYSKAPLPSPSVRSSFLRTCDKPKEPPPDSRFQVKIVCVKDKYKNEQIGQSSITINWTLREPWPSSYNPRSRKNDASRLTLEIIMDPKYVQGIVHAQGLTKYTSFVTQPATTDKLGIGYADYYSGSVKIYLNNTNQYHTLSSTSTGFYPGKYLITASLKGTFDKNQLIYESKDEVMIEIEP